MISRKIFRFFFVPSCWDKTPKKTILVAFFVFEMPKKQFVVLWLIFFFLVLHKFGSYRIEVNKSTGFVELFLCRFLF